MKAADVVANRSGDWRKLEEHIGWLRSTPARQREPARVVEFARVYRDTCSDLALAISMQFPTGTVDYLQQLVADAHTELYRTESFSVLAWLRDLFVGVPRRTLGDPCTWIAAAVFGVLFFGSIAAAFNRPDFAASVVGDAALANFEAMYADRPDSDDFANSRAAMTGFYVFNNAGIGLRCFAGGILLGVGSLVVLAFNGLFLGTVFGHMLGSPQADNFSEFVIAHAPFELTAIVLSAAAGLRLGWSLIDTDGWGRWESLRRTAPQTLAAAGLATILFILAAFIEGFVSPAEIGRGPKIAVACICLALLAGYFFVPAWSRWKGHNAD